jgi:hypothetical protein
MREIPDVYLTGLLSKEQLHQGVVGLAKFIQCHFGGSIVQAQYGYGCNLHPELCYREMKVGVGWLDKFIADSLRQEIVVLGDSDFTITVPENRLTVLFCHEGDIHLGGSDMEVQKELLLGEPFNSFRLIRAPHLPEPPKPKQPWF